MLQDSLITNHVNVQPFSPNVILVQGRPAVTSLTIAEHFGKPHRSVLRDIRSTMAKCPEEFNAHNFVPVKYTDAKGEERDAFNVFQDGFIIVVMGYTGVQAMKIKLAYIMVFNTMRDQISGEKHPTPALESTAPPSTAADRAPLRSLVYAWSQAAALPINSCWPQVKAHFQLSRIDDLPLEWIPDALAFVQGKIDGLPKALPESNVSLDPETAAYLAGKYPLARDAFMNSTNPQADASAALIARLCAELRFHANSMRENEREIYAAIKRAQTGPIFNPADPRRDTYYSMRKTMDRIFYVLDNAIEAAESHASTMCVMNKR